MGGVCTILEMAYVGVYHIRDGIHGGVYVPYQRWHTWGVCVPY